MRGGCSGRYRCEGGEHTECDAQEPGEEVCNGVDDNCDGKVDEEGAEGCEVLFYDEDRDGYGANVAAVCYCKPTGVYRATVSGDCNDNDDTMSPVATETCDGKDNNCNGQVDEGVQKTFFKDNDSDGYGGQTTQQGCAAPQGYTEESGDCNDFNKDIHPGAKEQCNDIDDCNGLIDDGLPTQTIYKDNDGDGFSAANAPSKEKCDVPTGWTTKNAPPGCNDTDITVYPGATELCDGKDNDCSGHADEPCPTLCSGNWPTQVGSWRNALFYDLDRDGFKEIYFSGGGGVRTVDGILLTNSLPGVDWNYRTFGDIDGDLSVGVVQTGGIYKRQTGWTFEKFADQPFEKPGVSDINGDPRLDVFGEIYEDTDGNGQGCRPGVMFVRNTSPLHVDIVRLPYPITDPSARSHCAIAPAAADLDGDGVEEILFGQSHSQSPNNGKPLDGNLYVYRCTDAPTCHAWSLSVWSNGKTCGAWWSEHTWVGDYLGDGSLALYFWNGCSAPIFDSQGDVIGDMYVAFTGLADTNGNGRFDEGTCTGHVDVDGDGAIDCFTHGGIKDGKTGQWFSGFPLPHDADWIVGDDLEHDGRLEIITTATTGKAYCYRLGEGSYHQRSLLLQWYPGLSPLQRNGKADSLEPNDRIEWDDQGNVTFNAATRYVYQANTPYPLRSFISRPGDVDWFEAHSPYANARVLVPQGKDFDIEIYCENKSKGAGQPGLVKLAESKKVGDSDEYANAGHLPYNEKAQEYCASLNRYFVKVFGKTVSDFGTRPYLFRANIH